MANIQAVIVKTLSAPEEIWDIEDYVYIPVGAHELRDKHSINKLARFAFLNIPKEFTKERIDVALALNQCEELGIGLLWAYGPDEGYFQVQVPRATNEQT